MKDVTLLRDAGLFEDLAGVAKSLCMFLRLSSFVANASSSLCIRSLAWLPTSRFTQRMTTKLLSKDDTLTLDLLG
ncbi:MAG TPA: hypothetical protein VGO47_11625, partial [Chlamydiales bacterium]|nr:hypothetical protein [Chlamydiales bacterium]